MRGKPFVKGDPRCYRKGRPVGSFEKKWYDIRWWYNLIVENQEKLTPRDKVELGLKGMALLIQRLPNIPATPEESVQRVIDVHGSLEKAESNANTRPSDDGVRMGTSPPQI